MTLTKKLESFNAKMSSQKWEKKSDGRYILKSNVVFDVKQSKHEIVDILRGIDEVISFELP